MVIVGSCGLCRIERSLTVVRDDIQICETCDHVVRLSVEHEDPVPCSTCGREQSWLWGEFISPEVFRCKRCEALEIVLHEI